MASTASQLAKLGDTIIRRDFSVVRLVAFMGRKFPDTATILCLVVDFNTHPQRIVLVHARRQRCQRPVHMLICAVQIHDSLLLDVLVWKVLSAVSTKVTEYNSQEDSTMI
jgi:hypothetical protein